MRLCYIANQDIHTRRFLGHFAEQGHDVHLIAFGPSHGPMPPGVTCHHLTAPARTPGRRPGGGGRTAFAARLVRWARWIRAVRGLVASLRPDVLHAHQIATAGWLAAATGYHPFVATAWGSDLLVGVRRSWLQRWLARWTLGCADYVTCLSQDLARVARALGAEPARVEVAPMGVDVSIYHPVADRRSLRHALGLDLGPLVLSVRSVREVYRPLDVAQAIPGILRHIPDARFLIRTHNSDAALLKRFQALVEEAGASAAVRYTGDLPDEEAIARLYQAADVALSVPSSDGTPSSVLEALACGAVPVVSDLPSLREWVQHGCEALLVPVGDIQGIASAVVRLLADPVLRQTMADQGARLVRERADSRVCMRRYDELYAGLCRPPEGLAHRT